MPSGAGLFHNAELFRRQPRVSKQSLRVCCIGPDPVSPPMKRKKPRIGRAAMFPARMVGSECAMVGMSHGRASQLTQHEENDARFTRRSEAMIEFVICAPLQYGQISTIQTRFRLIRYCYAARRIFLILRPCLRTLIRAVPH